MLVRIERYYNYPDIKRQTPNESFIWNGITFTEEDVEECDFLVILDYPKKDFTTRVNKSRILHICLEPANEISKYRQYANKQASIVFNQIRNDKNFIKSQPALPWHLDHNYDYLKALKPCDMNKLDVISWVTSNQRSSIQHKKRMDFYDDIKNCEEVKIYGRGINEIESKWDVFKDSKYAIAYENFTNPFYWTEKVADCFLSYNMPLYYGCTEIYKYFPKESIIELDPNDKHIDLFFKEIINSRKWENNLDAIEHSRKLVLEQYQLFPFLYNQIQAIISREGNEVFLKQIFNFKGGNAYFDNYPFTLDLLRFKRKINHKIDLLFFETKV